LEPTALIAKTAAFEIPIPSSHGLTCRGRYAVHLLKIASGISLTGGVFASSLIYQRVMHLERAHDYSCPALFFFLPEADFTGAGQKVSIDHHEGTCGDVKELDLLANKFTAVQAAIFACQVAVFAPFQFLV
jgi:hypothetical protein